MTEWKIVTPDMIAVVKGPPPCDDTGWFCKEVREWCRNAGILMTDHRLWYLG